MCTLKNDSQIAVGMTEGNVLILLCEEDISVRMESRFRDIGGIWSICACNKDNDLALGTISGLYIV